MARMAALVLMCLSLLAHAGTPERVDIGKRWLLAEAPESPISIETIDSQPLNWHASRWASPNLGFVSGAYWLRLDLAANELSPGRWRLWIHNSLLSDITFYLVSNGTMIAKQQDGLWVRYQDRAYSFRTPAFALSILPDRPYRIYLRVRSETALQVPAELVTEQQFLAEKEASDLALGVFVGVLLAMALYNLLLFVVNRELSFLLYVGHACGLLVFVASWQGLGATYLWPGLVGMQSVSIALATFLVIGFSTWFCGAFLELDADNFPWIRVFWGVRNLAFAGVLLTPLMPFRMAIIASSTLSFPAVILVVKAIVARFSLRQRPIRLFALGWAMYVSGAFMMGLNKFGFIDVTPASENMLLWSSVLDMVLLCIALGDRFHFKRRQRLVRLEQRLDTAYQKLESQQDKLEQTRAAVDELNSALTGHENHGRQLQSRLLERNRDLEQAKKLLDNAAETDALTGLKNRRYFSDRLLDEIERNRHLGGCFSILIVDVDRFRQINESFGHLTGDECLCQIADILRLQLKRPADVLCRIGGKKFAVMLPDTPAHGALQLAEQMRRRVAECPLLCSGQGIMVTVSIGVSEYENDNSLRPDQFLGKAGRALQQAKSDGRNCVAALV